MSSTFIDHVFRLFFDSLARAAQGGVMRQGDNFFAEDGAPAYLSAVAAVEAFVNEFFLSDFALRFLGSTPVTMLPADWLERVEIRKKILLVPQLVAGRTLVRGEQPYQDFAMLVAVRNELVHYKMAGPPPFVGPLAQRRIALRVEPEAEALGGGIAWPNQIRTTEGIRWAHNTAVETVHVLAQLIPEESRAFAASVADSWKPITDEVRRAKMRDLGLAPAGG